MTTKYGWLLALDSYANETYGRTISSAVLGATCVSCGGPAYRFTQPEAAGVYLRSGLCEVCQDAQTPISDTIIPFNQNYRTQP